MSETKKVYEGGRGMDHWTMDQVEGQRSMCNRDLEMIEHELKALKRKEQQLLDQMADVDAEIIERYECGMEDD